MRLEDAFFYLALTAEQADPGLCRALVEVGVDVIQFDANAPQGDALVAACREADALAIVSPDMRERADGVVLQGGEGLGMARALAGPDALVGAATHTLDEATMALEVGVDFVVHGPGTQGVMAVDALRDRVRVPFYVGLLEHVDDCRQVVEQGVIRLAVSGVALGEHDPVGEAARISRLLGRSV